ncbi:class I SAM-dependent methyltransferase [Egibacter rhizosphaerae]|uniref:Class I SAM-dependent methyltransferase n=1 Tax=Egibacter rhizosphaerae TaxID=1670831 RepID=A0A411YI94_9ACTN|nr:class I SAM-dependent methyltransferase [Egibacter rhizosphaerae]QBI20792.1 class I SAM-dependent methyltransferase [Egibacter rhizosphaerae]
MSADYGYAFGDDEAARRRLELVDAVFSPTSRTFLAQLGERYGAPQLAVDLGCGIGRTTRMLHEATGAERTVGLDASGDAIHEASRHTTGSLEFLTHDLSEDPLPIAHVDVLYGRLVLTHLAEPAARLQAWSEHLAAGGVLAVEEIAATDADHPALADHLGVVADLLAASGRDLHAGARLPSEVPPLRVAVDTTAEVRADAPTAARMFRMNLPGLARSAGTLDDGGALLARVQALDAPLGAVVERDEAGTVTWTLRHLALERA